MYRNDIDGLRAIAVLAVVVNHFSGSWLPGGYLGVDIFFVISGFVITRSLQDEPAKLSSFLLDFYKRRVRRILPALLVCVIVTGFLTTLVNPMPTLSLKTGAASVIGLSNLYLLRQASDYFADSTKLNSFTHTWSLGVEEQFYFCYPVLAWLMLKSGRLASRYFLPVLGGICVVSLVAFAAFQSSKSIAVFYLLPFRFWELGLGCLLAQAGNSAIRRRRCVAVALALTAMAVCLTLPEHAIVVATVVVVAATGALLYLGGGDLWSDRVLSLQIMRFVGKISYSLYLWHWPVLVLSRWTIGIHWWSAPFQFLVMVALAAASHRLVETPWRKPRIGEPASRTIGFGLGASAIAGGLLLVFATPVQTRLFLGERAPISERGPSSLSHTFALSGFGEWGGQACVFGSNADAQKPIDAPRCTLGGAASSHRMLVIGNSYAAAFVRGFAPLVRDHGFAVTLISSWGASPTPSIPNRSQWSRASDVLWNSVYPRQAAGLGKGDVVVLLSDLVDLAPGQATAETTEHLQFLRSDLMSMSADLRVKGVRLVFVETLPFVRDADCTPDAANPQWYAPFGSPCQFKPRAYHIKRREAMHRLTRDLENAGLLTGIDLFDVFCPNATCTYSAAKVPMLYRDEYSHPSVEVMPLVGAEIVSQLRRKRLLGEALRK